MPDGRRKPVWEPRNESQTNVSQFIHHLNQKHNMSLQTYDDLHRWSVASDSLQDFWRDAYDWLQLAPSRTKNTSSMLETTVRIPFSITGRRLEVKDESIFC